jgi:hypothetical protein
LPAIDELETTITTLGETAADQDKRSVQPQNVRYDNGIEAILEAGKTASPPSSPGISSKEDCKEDFDRVEASDAAAPPHAPLKTSGETDEDYDEFLQEDLRRLDALDDHYSSCYSSDSTNAHDPEWEDDLSVDEDYLAADLDLDEEVRRLENTIPTRVTKRTNHVKHGPEMPLNERKKHLDASRHAMLREAEIHNNESTAAIIFTGNLSPTLRTMDQVRRERLRIGLTFPNRETILLRVAEEANLRQLYFSTVKSDSAKVLCKGKEGFLVYANNSVADGWKITKCNVRVEDNSDTSMLNDQSASTPAKSVPEKRSPYKAAWIVPLIASTIADTPMASAQVLQSLLAPYGHRYCFSNSIIQNARSEARKLIFGDPDNNVAYAMFVQEELQREGHHVVLEFKSRREIIRKMEKVVIADEMNRRKEHKLEPLLAHERMPFITQWKQANSDVLMAHVGSATESHPLKFLDGIFFAPSFSTSTVPYLQRVFMADACHLHFGKYNLFGCYGVTANSNMSPVGFAILFGNENGESWRAFWKFIRSLHPEMNADDVTLITDQDKGQMGALAQEMPNVVQFHCSWHRRQNIMKRCGGGGGKMPYSAMWMYNKLVGARSVQLLDHYKMEHFPKMDNFDLTYLNSIPDTSQYPASRCAMGENIYMYRRSASSGAESMNAAYKEVRARTAVDCLNACIILTKSECVRFLRHKEKAWQTESVLTPAGVEELTSIVHEISDTMFRVTVMEQDVEWKCLVQRSGVGSNRHTCTFPKEPMNGSHFGRCTCKRDKTSAAPCNHMVAAVQSGRLPPVFTTVSIMPWWWRREHWQKQLPKDVYPSCSHTIQSIKENRLPDYTIRYAPDWVAGKKSGRPKDAERKKSGLELAMTKARKKMKRTDSSGEDKRARKKKGEGRIRCEICGKFNHESKDCTLLQRRVMPELEVDCGKDAEKDMSGEEEVVDVTQTSTEDDERFNEDGMEGAL